MQRVSGEERQHHHQAQAQWTDPTANKVETQEYFGATGAQALSELGKSGQDNLGLKVSEAMTLSLVSESSHISSRRSEEV